MAQVLDNNEDKYENNIKYNEITVCVILMWITIILRIMIVMTNRRIITIRK